MTAFRTIIIIVAAHVATGCSPSPAGHPPALAGEVRDSAGVRIVEHASLPADLPLWSLADPPEARIGGVDGTGPEVLGGVASIARQSDGTIVIADSRGAELRAFDSSGTHLWSAGGIGQGPGEFNVRIDHMILMHGDSLLAADAAGLVSVFSPDGDFARLWTLEPHRDGLGRPMVIDVRPDRSVLTISSLLDRPGELPPEGYVRITRVVALTDAEGRLQRELGVFPGEESFIDLQVATDGRLQGISVIRPNMSRTFAYSVGSTGLLASETDRIALHRFDTVGDLASVIRVSTPARLTQGETRRRALEDQPDRPLPDSLPAFGRALLDSRDRIWLREFVPSFEDRPAVWWVIDPDGTFLARVDVPHRFEPHIIDEDHVWGITLDEFEVPFVERRRIVR